MNRKLYDDLIEKGMDAAAARALATEHAGPGRDAADIDAVVDEVSRLAKGTVVLESVEELRADFDRRIGEANDIVEAVVTAADKAIDAATAGNATLAKGLSTVLRELQAIAGRLDNLESAVDGVSAVSGELQKGLSLIKATGALPARPLAADPTQHAVIAAPGDTTAAKTPMQIAEILGERARAEVDPAKRMHLAKGVSLALSGGDPATLVRDYGLA